MANSLLCSWIVDETWTGIKSLRAIIAERNCSECINCGCFFSVCVEESDRNWTDNETSSTGWCGYAPQVQSKRGESKCDIWSRKECGYWMSSSLLQKQIQIEKERQKEDGQNCVTENAHKRFTTHLISSLQKFHNFNDYFSILNYGAFPEWYSIYYNHLDHSAKKKLSLQRRTCNWNFVVKSFWKLIFDYSKVYRHNSILKAGTDLKPQNLRQFGTKLS